MFERRDWLIIARSSLVILLLGLTLSLNEGVDGAGVRSSDPDSSAWQPRNMTLVGQIGGPAYAVAVQANHAYLGIGPRLWVLNVSDPAHPAVVGVSEEMPDYVSDVVVSGNRAYVVWSGYVGPFNSGLWILDISDPTQPRTMGRYSMPGWWVDRIHLTGDYVYVAARYRGGLRILDVSDPTVPQEVGSYQPPGAVVDVHVAGRYAYLAWRESDDPDPGGTGVRVVDVADPGTPAEVAFYAMPDIVYRLYVAENLLYVIDGGGLRIVDISDPAELHLLGSYPVHVWGGDVQVVGHYAYLASAALHIIDVADPAAPMRVGVYQESGGRAMAIADGYVYLAQASAGLSVVDVSDPQRPVLAGSYQAPNNPNDVDVVGHYAYVTDATTSARIGRRLRIIDISNPAVPAEVSSYRLPGGIYHLSVSGHHAYIATGFDYGVHILDVSDPTALREVGLYDAEGGERDIHVVGRYAYIVAMSYEGDDVHSRLEVVDVADPTSPARVGVYEFPREVSDVFVADEIAYIVSNMCAPMSGGSYCFGVVRLVDVATPEAPKLLSVYRPPGSARSVFVTGEYAYVADGSAGLRIVDVSDPTRPREIGGTAPMPAATVHVSGDYAYVGVDRRGTADYSGVHVFDVSNPGAPVEVSFYLMRGVPFGIDVAGGYAYVAADWAGLMILRLTPPRLWRVFLPLLPVTTGTRVGITTHVP
jgi:hypothetical protein